MTWRFITAAALVLGCSASVCAAAPREVLLGTFGDFEETSVSVRVVLRKFDPKLRPDLVARRRDRRTVYEFTDRPTRFNPAGIPRCDIARIELAWGAKRFALPPQAYNDLLDIGHSFDQPQKGTGKRDYLMCVVSEDGASVMFKLHNGDASEHYEISFIVANDGRWFRFEKHGEYAGVHLLQPNYNPVWPLLAEEAVGRQVETVDR